MSEDIYIDVNYLTESERDIILQVLAKDEELRKQEKRRISSLKNELDQIKKNGASQEEIESSRICARCRSPLGLIINSGALCPKCEARVCKVCREMTSYSWLCILCAKIREVRAESGAWFFEQERRKGDRPQLYGSALVRASFRRAKPTSQAKNEVKDGDPGSPPVITLNLSNHERLHRPVPVHMSRLAEKDVEEEEEEERKNAVEINQNYKQYVKATRVPRKPEEEQHDPDVQEKGSSSSATSTPRGSPVNVLDSDAIEVADKEETVFEHLKNQDHNKTEADEEEEEGMTEQDVPGWKANVTHGDVIANGYSVEEAQGYEEKVNDWRNDREEESVHIGEQPKDQPVVEVKTKWHEVADEWGGTGDSYEQPAPDTYLHKQLLSVRSVSPDSETTGEFFTPLTTPLHSGTGTPALSDYGQSEGMGSSSDVYEDAGDTTPIEGDRTPVSELEKDDVVDNIGDVTVTNPEIKCTSPDIAEPEEGQRTPAHDDDIDQAFAMYERDHPGTKTLQEQLNILTMGSRESIVSYYSDAGEGRFGNIPVSGEVLFGLKYNKHKHQLEVQIHRAKDIAAADEKRGRSDPYVKVYLLPDKTKGGKRKTKTKKNTLNPDFDEILTFKIGFEEMLTRTLWLAMWNHDTFGHNDFLGEVMLPLETYQESGFSWDDPSPNWYPFHERRPEPSLMSYCGDLTVSLMYEPGEESHKDKKKKKKSGGKLHIQLKGARNLPAKDSNGFSDPFCKRNFPKLFDNNPSETKSETKSEVDQAAEKTQTPEQVSLVSSHENLAFEEEDKHLEPKDTSVDSTNSTMETTLESIDSEGSHDLKDSQKEGDDSGISVSHMKGSDVSPAEEGSTTGGEDDQDPEQVERDMQPVLKSISAFSMQFMVVSPPEIKVDKPLTLSAAAKGQDKKDAPPPTPPQSPRRHTDHSIKNTIKKSSLLPEAALIKRRHSDFAVSAPRPINEELAMADLKKRGSQEADTGRKGSHPDVIKVGRGPQWSPSLERKKIEEAKKGKKIETRRKTLAELALEAGYTPSPDSTEPSVAHLKALQVTKAEASRGSNESLLSDPGEEHYSSVPVTGELFVSLRYEMPSKKFEVHVHSANNLACVDAKRSSSDPYVKSYLLPDRRSKRKTKPKKDTLNPHFDEVLEYFIGYDELLTRTLFLSVWHKTIARNYFLGEVKIPVNNFVEAGNSLEQPIAKWFNLTDKTDETDGLPSIPCELVLALKYVTADKVKKRGRHKGELHVHLLEARNLPGMDADGMSDPYCKCILLPDKKGKFKHKTPVIKRTLNPTFDHKFSYDEVSPEDLKERVLEITIYDFDRASSDDFLGGVRLGLGTSSNEWDDATEDECQIWHTMLSRSNVWIQVVVPLRSSMTPKKKE